MWFEYSTLQHICRPANIVARSCKYMDMTACVFIEMYILKSGKCCFLTVVLVVTNETQHVTFH